MQWQKNSVIQLHWIYMVISPCTTTGCWTSLVKQAGCCIPSPPPPLIIMFALRVKSPQTASKSCSEGGNSPSIWFPQEKWGYCRLALNQRRSKRLCVCVCVVCTYEESYPSLPFISKSLVCGGNVCVIWLARSDMSGERSDNTQPSVGRDELEIIWESVYHV